MVHTSSLRLSFAEIPVPPKYPYFYLWFSVRNALLYLFAQKRLSRI
jgi:hypothetical protein